MEEYPLSRAFLVLLDSLCSAGPLPRTLGAGSRPPGLDPYVEHVLNRVALPAPHRPYTRPSEKWEVMTLGMISLLYVTCYVAQCDGGRSVLEGLVRLGWLHSI